jgi:hypothetical protein
MKFNKNTIKFKNFMRHVDNITNCILTSVYEYVYRYYCNP